LLLNMRWIHACYVGQPLVIRRSYHRRGHFSVGQVAVTRLEVLGQKRLHILEGRHSSGLIYPCCPQENVSGGVKVDSSGNTGVEALDSEGKACSSRGYIKSKVHRSMGALKSKALHEDDDSCFLLVPHSNGARSLFWNVRYAQLPTRSPGCILLQSLNHFMHSSVFSFLYAEY
jgi:hypothetical protein